MGRLHIVGVWVLVVLGVLLLLFRLFGILLVWRFGSIIIAFLLVWCFGSIIIAFLLFWRFACLVVWILRAALVSRFTCSRPLHWIE